MGEVDTLTTYKVKLAKAEVEQLRALARREAVRENRDISWCELVRSAVQYMNHFARPVGR